MPSLGYHDEFHLDDGGDLTKILGVKEIQIPVGGQRELVDVTDLDAVGWRRDFIPGFYEDTDFEVVMNAEFLSASDVLLTEAREAGDVRPFKIALAENGTLTAQIEGTARCTGYGYGTISVGEVKEATATFRVVTVGAIEAYAA